MQIKNVIVAALVGLAAVGEASAIPGDSPFSKTLARRQFRGGNGRFGGNRGGGGNNNNGGMAQHLFKCTEDTDMFS